MVWDVVFTAIIHYVCILVLFATFWLVLLVLYGALCCMVQFGALWCMVHFGAFRCLNQGGSQITVIPAFQRVIHNRRIKQKRRLKQKLKRRRLKESQNFCVEKQTIPEQTERNKLQLSFYQTSVCSLFGLLNELLLL